MYLKGAVWLQIKEKSWISSIEMREFVQKVFLDSKFSADFQASIHVLKNSADYFSARNA